MRVKLQRLLHSMCSPHTNCPQFLKFAVSSQFQCQLYYVFILPLIFYFSLLSHFLFCLFLFFPYAFPLFATRLCSPLLDFLDPAEIFHFFLVGNGFVENPTLPLSVNKILFSSSNLHVGSSLVLILSPAPRGLEKFDCAYP